METIRTPEDRFVNFPDYSFAPYYAEIPDLDGGTLRMHSVDEGPRDAPPVVMIHGNLGTFLPWLEVTRVGTR